MRHQHLQSGGGGGGQRWRGLVVLPALLPLQQLQGLLRQP
jgi:hypothetical protein